MVEGLGSKRIKEANRIIFNQQSSLYHKKRRVAFDKETALRIKKRYEEAMGNRFERAERVLDLGCGGGRILLNLAQLGLVGKGYGLDLSSGMLKECTVYAGKMGLSVHLVEGDAEYLPFKDDSFDLIIGHAVLHHLPDTKKVLPELRRVLGNKGRCILTEPARAGSRIIRIILWVVWFIPMLIRQWTKKDIERSVEISSFDAAELEGQAREAGFTRIDTRPFAGFSSRIFYWVMDPVSQRISGRYYHLILDRIIDILYIFDRRIFKHILPQGWFDELFIKLEKNGA
jgi:ubiquinone/menaquinone biosynthesis C-methylase UbiE